MPDRHSHLSPKTKKLITVISLIIFVLFFGLIAWFIGRPMIEFVRTPEVFRQWVDEHGFLGKLAFVGMQVLQVIVAIIPGEPLEIGAGYAFGMWEGLILCLIGAFIGGAITFMFARFFGMKAVEAFFSKEKIGSLKFLQNAKRLEVIIFIPFFIPGTPKDLLSYLGGLTPIKPHVWLLITTFARIPSIITSTMVGDELGEKRYLYAAIVAAATMLVSAIGVIIYNAMAK